MTARPSASSSSQSIASDGDAGVISDSYVGTVTQRLISLCAERFGAAARPEQVIQAASAVKPKGSIVARQALRMNAVTLAASYFRDFAPISSAFVGSEIWVGPQPVDLIWKREGVIWIDELKTGATPAGNTNEGLKLQVQAQWQAGAFEFGENWGGVRAILLDRPEHSFFVDASGSTQGEVPR